MQPIKIDFVVGDKGASKKIDKVTHSLEALDAASKNAGKTSSTTQFDEQRLAVIEQQTAALDKQLDKAIQIREAMDAKGIASVGSFRAKELDAYIEQLLEVRTLMNDLEGKETINQDALKNLSSPAQKILDDYRAGLKEIEKAEGELLDALLASNEKAAPKLEAFAQSQLLKKGSLEELQSALARYKLELDQAIASEDDLASLEAQKRIAATEQAIEKRIASSEKETDKAEAQAEAFAHAQLLKAGSLEELEDALEKYRAELVEANKAENKIGSLKIEKRIAATEQAIKRQTTATERATLADQRRNAEILRGGNIAERIFSEVASAALNAAATTTKATGALGFFRRGLAITTAAVRGFSVAVKAALGPIGIALLAFEAVTWAVIKAWDALVGWFTKGAREAKKASDTISKQADEASRLADEAERAAKSALHDYNAREQEKDFLEAVEKITSEYKDQTTEIERQLRLRKYGLDEEARAIEHAHDIKKAEIELAAIREGWTDRQLEVALRGNATSRNNALGVLSSQQEQAEVEAAEKKKQAAEQTETRANDLILSQAFSSSDARSLQDILSRLPLLAKQADNAQKQQNEAITGEQQARALLVWSEQGWDKSGSDLEGDDLEKVKKNLSILGLEEADITSLSSDELKEAFRQAENAYIDVYKEVSEESIEALRSLISKSGLSASTFANTDGTLDTELAERMVTTILNNAINARTEADKARRQREEADSNLTEAQTRKTTQSKARARSTEIATKRATVDGARYQAEIEAQALREKQELELERRDALYSTSNSDRLNRRVKKLRGREDTAFNQADEENARAALEEKVLAEADAILEDGRISKEEISRLPSILEKMETVGISKDVIAMLKQLEQMASQQADESIYLRSELRAIKGKMAITERSITQLAKGR